MRILADRYELEEKLGEGGMGIVYRARDRRLERTVAVKVLRPYVATTLTSEWHERVERCFTALRVFQPRTERTRAACNSAGVSLAMLQFLPASESRPNLRELAWGSAPGAQQQQ